MGRRHNWRGLLIRHALGDALDRGDISVTYKKENTERLLEKSRLGKPLTSDDYMSLVFDTGGPLEPTFGYRLWQAMRSSEYESEAELAIELGIDVSVILFHLLDESPPREIDPKPTNTVLKLSEALEVSPAWLIGETDDGGPEERDFLNPVGYKPQLPIGSSEWVQLITFTVALHKYCVWKKLAAQMELSKADALDFEGFLIPWMRDKLESALLFGDLDDVLFCACIGEARS